MDCTKYGVSELELVIDNTEYLYINRHNLTKQCLFELNIQFTDEQWQHFQDNLELE